MSYNICNKKSCNQFHNNYYYGLCLIEMDEEMPDDCLMRHKGKNFNRTDTVIRAVRAAINEGYELQGGEKK